MLIWSESSLEGGVIELIELEEPLEDCRKFTRREDLLQGIEGYDDRDTERVSCL